MTDLTIGKIKNIITTSAYKASFKKNLKFNEAAVKMFLDYELIPIFDNKRNGFLLLFNFDTAQYVAIHFESIKLSTDLSGRKKPAICDLCFTWQSGGSISRVTFESPIKGGQAIGLLCCSKLDCSLHVRKLTVASITSQAQLNESIDQSSRIQRLRDHYGERILKQILV